MPHPGACAVREDEQPSRALRAFENCGYVADIFDGESELTFGRHPAILPEANDRDSKSEQAFGGKTACTCGRVERSMT
jgi:hypothetical protein